MKQCIVCRKPCREKLCPSCEGKYLFNTIHNFYRLNKKQLIHDNIRESRLRKVLKKIFPAENIYEEIIFEDCVNPKTGAVLRYDFAIVNKDSFFLIEFHGRQHYKFTKFFHKSKKDFLQQKYRDKIKQLYADNRNIPLLIIPYHNVINVLSITKLLKRHNIRRK